MMFHQALCDLGYSASDIITTVFRVVRNSDLAEFLKLEFIKVRLGSSYFTTAYHNCCGQPQISGFFFDMAGYSVASLLPLCL